MPGCHRIWLGRVRQQGCNFAFHVVVVIIREGFDFTSRTFDFFETAFEEESLASIEREDLFGRNDRLSGDAVISFSASGLAFGGT